MAGRRSTAVLITTQGAATGLLVSVGVCTVLAMTLVEQLVAVAMTHATDTFDDEVAIAQLRRLADDEQQALEQAIPTCLAQPTNLAARRRAIEFLARIRYEDPPAP
jgi:hypothetical protein